MARKGPWEERKDGSNERGLANVGARRKGCSLAGGASFGPLLQETIAQGPQAVTGGLVLGEKGTELLL